MAEMRQRMKKMSSVRCRGSFKLLNSSSVGPVVVIVGVDANVVDVDDAFCCGSMRMEDVGVGVGNGEEVEVRSASLMQMGHE